MNYRFLTTETNLKASYIFRCLFTASSVKLFVVSFEELRYAHYIVANPICLKRNSS